MNRGITVPGMRLRPVALAAAATVAALPAAAAASTPSTVAFDPTQVASVFEVGAAPGDVVVDQDLLTFAVSFEDFGNQLVAGFGCTPGTPVFCPFGDVRVLLDDDADRARVFTIGGRATILGGEGDDELRAFAIREQVLAGPGDDTVFVRSRQADVHGNGNTDEIYAAEVFANLSGGGGNDLLVSDTNFGNLTGGGGFDVLIRGGSAEAGVMSGGNDPDIIGFASDYEGFGAAWTLDGGGLYDWIHGSPGPDTVLGGEGNDEIWVFGGDADTVDCGTGFDEVNVDESDVVTNCERVRHNAGPPDPRFELALARAADLKARASAP
jgi:Ca2+-binding RTX toxin-like protein